VLHCIPQLEHGGAERQLRTLAPLLVERGIDVSLYCRFTTGRMNELSAAGVNCFPLRHGHLLDPRAVLDMARLVRLVRPNVVQSWLTPMDILAAVLHPRNAAWVLSERSSHLAYSRGIKDALRKRLGRRADLIIANSPAGADFWASAGRAMVIPNGVDGSFFDPVRTTRLAPLLQGRTVLVSIARLTSSKRMEILFDAVGRLRARHPNVILVLLGEGPERPALETAAAKADLVGHIHFAGHDRDVAAWLAWADAFVSASAFEGQSNSVLEAAAAGVPLVLSDVEGHRNAIGDAAMMVAEPSGEAFAQAIAALLGDAARREQLSLAARRKASAASFDAAADAYADVYRRLAREGVNRAG
jgi:glycosyltransferase involved in cell wall biosynthesis